MRRPLIVNGFQHRPAAPAGYPVKRNGNSPAAPVRARRLRLETRSPQARQISSTINPAGGSASVAVHEPEVTRRTSSACMTCMATYANGFKTAGTRIITAHRATAPHGLKQVMRGVSSVAVHGIICRACCGVPGATGGRPVIAWTMSAFASPLVILKNLTANDHGTENFQNALGSRRQS